MLEGKTALVTGAGRGIGRQIALTLAAEGADVIVNCNASCEQAEKTAEEIRKLGRREEVLQASVADFQACGDMVKKALELFGHIDILVNNAGINIINEFSEFSTEDWDKVVNINLRGQFIMSREVCKLMKKQNYGKIINTASVGGYAGGASQIAYYASKGGVVNFTRALASELAPYHVTVNAIGPGVFDTEMTHDSLDGDFAKYLEGRVPLGRWGKDGELDGALIYFASDASSYCTGQTLYVDGGMVCVL